MRMMLIDLSSDILLAPKVGELFPRTFLCWCFERMDASPFPNPEPYTTSCPFLSPLLVTHKTSFLPHMHRFFSLHFQCYFSLLHMKAVQFPSIHGHAQHMSAAHTGTTARGHEVAASVACLGMECAWSELPRHGWLGLGIRSVRFLDF